MLHNLKEMIIGIFSNLSESKVHINEKQRLNKNLLYIAGNYLHQYKESNQLM